MDTSEGIKEVWDEFVTTDGPVLLEIKVPTQAFRHPIRADPDCVLSLVTAGFRPRHLHAQLATQQFGTVPHISPLVLVLRQCRPGGQRKNLGRPTRTPLENRTDFMEFLDRV